MSGVITETRPTMSAPAGNRGSVLSDTLAVFQREMYLVLRDPFSVIFSLVQPLVFLGLFGALLAGSVDSAVLGGSPLQWFLPGVIVMICLFGTGVAGSNLLFEITLGQLRAGAGQPAAAVVDPDRQVAQGAGAAGRSRPRWSRLVCIPFGFVLYPLHVLVGLAILGVFGVGMGAFSNALAGGGPQAGVDVLGGAAVAAVPAADPVRDAAAAGGRTAVDPDPRPLQPADLGRRRRAGPVRRLVDRSRDRLGGPGCGPHLRGRPLGRRSPGAAQHDVTRSSQSA
jgi:hypothetical protein